MAAFFLVSLLRRRESLFLSCQAHPSGRDGEADWALASPVCACAWVAAVLRCSWGPGPTVDTSLTVSESLECGRCSALPHEVAAEIRGDDEEESLGTRLARKQALGACWPA